MDEFLKLSSMLTGLPSLEKLDPQSVESRMARDYLRLMKEQFGPGFDALLAIFRTVATTPDPLKALLQDPGFANEASGSGRRFLRKGLCLARDPGPSHWLLAP
jgi:hypothetical protein